MPRSQGSRSPCQPKDHFGGTARLTVPTIRSAQATVRFPLPRFLQTGVYKLNVAILDTQGRSRRWTSDELVADGLPSQFEVRVTNDVAAPTVSRLQIAPVADLTRPQGAVRLTVFDESGVIAYRVVAASPTGRRVVLADYQSSVGDGPGHTFEAAFDLSNGLRDGVPVEQGLWTITEVQVTDSNGRSQTLTGRDLFNLEITSRFAVGDVEPEEEPGPACGAPNPVAVGATVRVPALADVYDLRGRRVARSGADGSLSTDGMARGVYLTRSATVDAPPCRFTVR